MKLGSLFTGYAGLDLAAAAVLGTETAWHCDNDPAAAKLLEHHYPGVPNLGDITAVDWKRVEPVDVITGGFPCTDISNAGKREGITGEQSGLWRHMSDAVRVLRPRYVLIENVSALVVRGLDRVLADLAALGFDAEWATVPASAVGAPHRRERIFISAYAQDDGHERAWDTRLRRAGSEDGRVPAADAAGCGHSDFTHGRNETGQHVGPIIGPGAGDSAGGSASGVHELDGATSVVAWGPYEPAIRRWAHILGRSAPAPTVTGARGGRVLNPALVEWMMGLPDGWITAVPGLSRNQMLKLAGNGVVPQQAIAAFEHLLAADLGAAA